MCALLMGVCLTTRFLELRLQSVMTGEQGMSMSSIVTDLFMFLFVCKKI
jgi:hypothetical protein